MTKFKSIDIMKRIWTTVFLCSVIWIGQAQVTTPKASVPEVSRTTVGLTEVGIEYSRPSKRDRTVFGEVVPYGELWRTGANANSTIEFTDNVVIDGQTLKAGKYAIFTVPNEENWEVFFYDETSNWGNQVKWDDTKVVAKTVAKVIKTNYTQETFSIALDHITSDSATLTFAWDNVIATSKIEVPTDKKAMASIKETMAGTPKAQDLLDAANYYYNTDRDINQAKNWIDQGIKMIEKPAFYQLHSQALIHAKAGDIKSAISIAKQSLDASKAANDNAYIRMNEALLKKLQ